MSAFARSLPRFAARRSIITPKQVPLVTNREALLRPITPAVLSGGRRFVTKDDEEVHVAPEGVEFTFSPYYDVNELGFNRAQEFCMMTLKHPKFESVETEAERFELYEQKRADRVQRVKNIFEMADFDKTNSLSPDQLKFALDKIGMPATEDWVHGLYQRHNKGSDQHLLPEEFEKVVTEAWGRIPDPAFSRSLHKANPHLKGLLGYAFIGRASPSNWVLRVVRNLWPIALKRVIILRNLYPNKHFRPELMEPLIDTYEGQKVRGLNSALDLAALASEQPPTEKGGLVVRIVPTGPGVKHWPEGGTSTMVPFRGFPENDPGFMGRMNVAWTRFTTG
mmetsp:Transcript_43434/g.93042  ORF Transcript_43434/g.93042 Transcript_43434/m.93042 type:complete len:336 (+) Transcript_43434:141-1148(+)|eukprot:CAMPEP_0206472706 /NCGR_PEP_ID=MMETSP0324_2-20121206/32380_1 /ASSEMBLY_ACC=CAM_ASM_000836 /TAXON_ID=2866 /ORGANISM="Crypthecodinium cohnii, Strain Seligo" /LENGTH=335 /DNA_ID=CAMNT_0053947397 /DNA_START=129 /DNA_END=1136 /DNA_ORIENTATION=+